MSRGFHMGGAGGGGQVSDDLMDYLWNLSNATKNANNIVLNNGLNAVATLGQPMDVTRYNMLNITVYAYTTNNFSFYYSIDISQDGNTWSSITGTRESPTNTGGRTDITQYNLASLTGNYYVRVRTWAGNATSTLTVTSAYLA